MSSPSVELPRAKGDQAEDGGLQPTHAGSVSIVTHLECLHDHISVITPRSWLIEPEQLLVVSDSPGTASTQTPK